MKIAHRVGHSYRAADRNVKCVGVYLPEINEVKFDTEMFLSDVGLL